MKTVAGLALLTCLLLMCSGCLYSNIRTPFDTDLHETKLGSKVGRASTNSAIWLVSWGDGGTAAAAREGGLTTINHMDLEVFILLFGLYVRQTTIVYGD